MLSTLEDSVSRFLFSRDIPFVLDDRGRFWLRIHPIDAKSAFQARLECNPKVGRILLSAFFPLTIPPDKRREIGDLLTRMNNEFILSGMVLDPSTGSLRYRSYLYMGQIVLAPEVLDHFLEHLIDAALVMLLKVSGPICSILFTNCAGPASFKQFVNS